MINANTCGFLPNNDAYTNSAALQRAVNEGGTVTVTLEGVYDISETVFIGDGTTLIFEKGVILRRQPSVTGKNTPVFINSGCDTNTYNYNIGIIGLHLDCNGVEDLDYGFDSSRHTV